MIFRKNNEHEKTLRASRLNRLASLKLPDFSTFRIADYCEEAKSSFIYGCFRSCIICSAIAAELTLKHTLIFLSEDWEQTYWEIEVKKFSFKKVIEELRRTNDKCTSLLRDADWLRKTRNEIVAHPLYIGNPFEIKQPGTLTPREPELEIWANRIMLRDIRKLLQFVEPDKRKTIEEKTFSKRDTKGKILEEFSVLDYLEQRKPVRYEPFDFTYWRIIQNELIEEIAFQAYRRMIKVLNALFPNK